MCEYSSKPECFCAYCKDPIFPEDEKAFEGSNVYHKDCLEQKNKFYDPLELTDEDI